MCKNQKVIDGVSVLESLESGIKLISFTGEEAKAISLEGVVNQSILYLFENLNRQLTKKILLDGVKVGDKEFREVRNDISKFKFPLNKGATKDSLEELLVKYKLLNHEIKNALNGIIALAPGILIPMKGNKGYYTFKELSNMGLNTLGKVLEQNYLNKDTVMDFSNKYAIEYSLIQPDAPEEYLIISPIRVYNGLQKENLNPEERELLEEISDLQAEKNLVILKGGSL